MLEVKIDYLLKEFDCFLCDVYGIIYDEAELYPGVMDMLQEIKKTNKKIIFISNAPRKSDILTKRFMDFNITEELYTSILTPGQMLYDDLIANRPINFTGRYFAFGLENDINLLDGKSNFTRVNNIENADFVVSFGMFDCDQKNSEIEKMLNICLERNLEMLCLNPDKIVKRKKNTVDFLCAGHISFIYEKMGGKVTWYGKPYKDIYERAIRIAKTPISKIVCIGDALETDIYGAHNAGLQSALVLTGLYDKLLDKNGKISWQEIKDNCSKFHYPQPDFVLKDLCI